MSLSPDGGGTERIVVSVPRTLIDRLDAVAAQRGVSRAALLREGALLVTDPVALAAHAAVKLAGGE